MTIDFGSLRRLILTSKHQLLNINKQIEDLKHDINEELEGIQEFREEVKIKERNIFEEDTFEKDNGLEDTIEKDNASVVNLVKEEKEKDFCDEILGCDYEQIHMHKVIFHFHYEKFPAKFK